MQGEIRNIVGLVHRILVILKSSRSEGGTRKSIR